MKKGLLMLLAALMLAAMLTGCAQTQPYNGGYSNVSTTRNGYVNGTNGYGNGAGDYLGWQNGMDTVTRYSSDYDARQTLPHAAEANVR